MVVAVGWSVLVSISIFQNNSKLVLSRTWSDLVNMIIFRFKSELKKLRKKYNTETEKAKNKFMNIHSKQVGTELFY